MEESRKIYHPESPCTCGQGDGHCGRHGRGRGGTDVHRLTSSRAAKERKRLALKGNRFAVKTGEFCRITPSLRCADCYAGTRCKLFREGSICRCDGDFLTLGQELEDFSPEKIEDFLWAKLKTDLRRLARGYFFEAVDGGLLDPSVTRLSSRVEKSMMVLLKIHHLRQGVPVNQQVYDSEAIQLDDFSQQELAQAVEIVSALGLDTSRLEAKRKAKLRTRERRDEAISESASQGSANGNDEG